MTGLFVSASAVELDAPARALAESLGLPYRALAEANAGELCLRLTPQHLQLQEGGERAAGPVSVDFTGGRLGYRLAHGGGRKQPLARAVGFKSGRPAPWVLDATAGLGRDAFVLAALGCRVQLLERSPVVAALLADGLRRALAHPESAPIAERMTLIRADALAYLQALEEHARPEVIYLDPMYPERQKSALVKKEMRLLRELLGGDEDAPALLAAALRQARRRVVVKRPGHAGPLGGCAPGAVVESENTRFDIYLATPY